MKLVTTGFLAAALLAAPLAASAADIKATLEKHKGSRVSLRLPSGDDITGKVVSVDGGTVHLSELAGREYFDAVVEIDDIAAVVFRAKEK
ncbi:MAG: hypothetical protein ACREQJ_17280 [Candidatus Binatia bacterium]